MNYPSNIESSSPIMISQYISSATMSGAIRQSFCNDNLIGQLGDPEMIYLSPIEQTINKVTINSTANNAIRDHFLNLVIHKDAILPGRRFLLEAYLLHLFLIPILQILIIFTFN